MNSALQMKKYHQRDIQSSSPEQLIQKLYGAGITACHQEDQEKVRAILMELISALDFEADPELANRLYSLYEYCLTESALGNFDDALDVLTGLREAWEEGVLQEEGPDGQED